MQEVGAQEHLLTVHRGDRKDPAASPEQSEVVLDDGWRILVTGSGSEDPLVGHAAHDLVDYLASSMGLTVPMVAADEQLIDRPTIVLCLADDAPEGSEPPYPDPRSHSIMVAPGQVVLAGRGAKGVLRAVHHLEQLLNLRTGPYLSIGSRVRTPTFDVRMSHSGYGVDDYPDAHLAQLAHAGIDAIVLFVTAPDRTPDGLVKRDPAANSAGRRQDFTELNERAARHGLDLYFYAYFSTADAPHPDDPGAQQYYDDTYGACFAVCPGAKGIVLVGESVEFPSKDERSTGRHRLHRPSDGLPEARRSPGWWPCRDYPQWVKQVRDACRRHNPDADIVFWTYNWGWAPEQDRLALIRKLPDDITVQATFEMFERFEHDGVTNVCVDYTASHVGPGAYFRSEAEAVHARGMRLATMANSTGLTWDIGVIPYQPIPYQWAERHRAVRQAKDDWGLVSLMENHHYGLWPSIISELADAMYHDPPPDPDMYIAALARRDFGDGAAEALAAWRDWSEASIHYVPTGGDQGGPFRIGPSYPLTLFGSPRLVTEPEVLHGDRIVHIPYQPEFKRSVPKTAPPRRVPAEIVSLKRMRTAWQSGSDHMERAVQLAPRHRRDEAERMLNLGRYVEHCVTTTINTKRWWLTRSRLVITADPDDADALITELRGIGEDEFHNATGALACVEADSRLGWEPSMGHLGDADHIRWKLAHLRDTLDRELVDHAITLRL